MNTPTCFMRKFVVLYGLSTHRTLQASLKHYTEKYGKIAVDSHLLLCISRTKEFPKLLHIFPRISTPDASIFRTANHHNFGDYGCRVGITWQTSFDLPSCFTCSWTYPCANHIHFICTMNVHCNTTRTQNTNTLQIHLMIFSINYLYKNRKCNIRFIGKFRLLNRSAALCVKTRRARKQLHVW